MTETTAYTGTQPNILWIFGDQHRAQSLGIAGDPNVFTPNLDRLAIEGVHFKQAISNNPWCCPARFMLMSGLYPHRGIDRTPSSQPMDPTLPTIATLLKEQGYHTSYFGKWHLDGQGKHAVANEGVRHIPRERRGGFDTWIGYENNNSQYDLHVHGYRLGDEVDSSKLPGYETDDLTDLLLRELDDRKAQPEQPFFAALSVQPPHVPNVAPAADMRRHNAGTVQLRPNVPPVPRIEELARRELAGYHAQIENIDMNVGRVLQRLRDNGQLDNTLIIFFSDHGDCMGSHGYREKSSPWEESIRVPLIIGGGIPYKKRRSGPSDAMISLIDLLPTTLGLAGAPVPDQMDGFNFAPLFLDRQEALPAQPESVYIQHRVRKMLNDGCDRKWRGVVTADGWKYACIDGAPYLMFNLNEDPYEMANLAFNQRFIQERTRLHGLLSEWIEKTGDDDFTMPEL
jgi:arylsulfatase A-like enzyme